MGLKFERERGKERNDVRVPKIGLMVSSSGLGGDLSHRKAKSEHKEKEKKGRVFWTIWTGRSGYAFIERKEGKRIDGQMTSICVCVCVCGCVNERDVLLLMATISLLAEGCVALPCVLCWVSLFTSERERVCDD